MPNWVENVLSITKGDPSVVWNTIRNHDRSQNPNYPDYDDTAFDFSRLIPMPAQLHDCGSVGTMSGIADDLLAGNGIGKYAEYQWVKDAGIITVEQLCAHWNYDYSEVVALGKLRGENRLKYGHPDWYDWRTHNWGTKWNACYVRHSTEAPNTTICFDTASSPPVPVFEALAKNFPQHEFIIHSDEYLNHFHATFHIKDGEVTGVNDGCSCLNEDTPRSNALDIALGVEEAPQPSSL
jgi:hypothetical protein